MTPNGKVDRAALPAPVFASANADAGVEKPRTGVERALTDIWSSVLGVGAVGVNDNFFDLGGHSLHAMMIISRLAETFAFHVSLREFFESPTVARMAEMIAAADPRDRPEGDLAEDRSRTTRRDNSWSERPRNWIRSGRPEAPAETEQHLV